MILQSNFQQKLEVSVTQEQNIFVLSKQCEIQVQYDVAFFHLHVHILQKYYSSAFRCYKN